MFRFQALSKHALALLFPVLAVGAAAQSAGETAA